MMPRFFALNRLARHGAIALMVLGAARGSYAGGDKDYGNPVTPPDTGNNGGGNRGNHGGGGRGSLDDNEVDHAAIIGQCGWTGRLPRSSPFDNSGSLVLAWQDGYLDVSKFEWSRSFANSGYKNSMCEMFLLEQLRRDNNGLARFRDRCESIRDDLLEEMNGEESGSSNVGNFSASQAFFGSSGSSGGGGSDSGSACADSDVLSGNERFACRVLALRDIESSPNSLKDYAKKIMSDCKKAGADMRRRMSQSEYNSYANSGISYVGGYCGGGAGGGAIIIQDKKSTLQTITDGLLGAFKIGAPLYVMNSANKRLNENAQLAINANTSLGFPSGTYAGSSIGGGGGYGGGGYGYGGGGYGYTGHGGSCPAGYCGGNGGIVVGGGGNYYGNGGAAGGVVGGTCGVPPYAPWSQSYGGCGAGGVGGGYTGAPGYGGNPWLNGGSGGIGGIGNGYGGNGFGNGIGGIGNGYGGNGIGNGLGGNGYRGNGIGSGVGGMPGAFGTLNGGNGWGGSGANMGQWGPGGLYGQTPFLGGGSNGYDAQQATLMAQQMQQYAQTIQRQADLAAKAQSRYKEDLDALSKTYSKSYQSYMAAQTASSGLSGLGGIGGGMYSGGGGGGGVYYPPYASGGGASLNFGLNYQSR